MRSAQRSTRPCLCVARTLKGYERALRRANARMIRGRYVARTMRHRCVARASVTDDTFRHTSSSRGTSTHARRPRCSSTRACRVPASSDPMGYPQTLLKPQRARPIPRGATSYPPWKTDHERRSSPSTDLASPLSRLTGTTRRFRGFVRADKAAPHAPHRRIVSARPHPAAPRAIAVDGRGARLGRGLVAPTACSPNDDRRPTTSNPRPVPSTPPIARSRPPYGCHGDR